MVGQWIAGLAIDRDVWAVDSCLADIDTSVDVVHVTEKSKCLVYSGIWRLATYLVVFKSASARVGYCPSVPPTVIAPRGGFGEEDEDADVPAMPEMKSTKRDAMLLIVAISMRAQSLEMLGSSWRVLF